MKEQAMNEMLAVVRSLRSKGNSVQEINRKMSASLRAYKRGRYAKSIELLKPVF